MNQYDLLYGYDKIPGITKMHLEIEQQAYKKEAAKVGTDLERIRGEKDHVQRELNAAAKSRQQGRINRHKKELEELLNREVKALIALNSVNAALQVVTKHINDLTGLPSAESIKLIDLPGRIKIT